MCGPKKPKVEQPTPAPQESDADVISARDAERKRRRAAASDTLLTGSQGVTGAANTDTKQLLGS